MLKYVPVIRSAKQGLTGFIAHALKRIDDGCVHTGEMQRVVGMVQIVHTADAYKIKSMRKRKKKK